MFFFFFGDLGPEVRKVIESRVAECPRCGSDASLVEYDNVFRAFFIPIWRWGGTNPAIHCNSCSFLQSLEQFQKRHTSLPELCQSEQRTIEAPDFGPSAPLLRCWSCSTLLQPEFQFCPQCGVSQQQ